MPALLEQEEEKTPIPLWRIFRFSAAEYNRLTEIGFFTPEQRVELLEGWLVNKMAQNELHATVLDLLEELLAKLLTEPWTFRTQRPVLLSGDNVPEPDLVIVPGPKRRYFRSHPTSKDIALVVEVSGASLDLDRGVKQTIYARDRLPLYWIVNLVDSRVEVYSSPRGGKSPAYRQMQIYGPDEAVPVVLRGEMVGEINVKDMLP